MLGIHLNRKHEQALDDTFLHKELRIPVYQIFLHNPRSGDLIGLPEELSGGLHGAKLYVHGPYVDRLTAGRHQNEGIAKRLMEAESVGAVGYVIHVYAEPIWQIMRALTRIFHKLDYKNMHIRIYLEAHVVSQKKVDELSVVKNDTKWTDGRYIDPKVMRALFSRIRDEEWGPWVRVCLDTAHAWACGWDLTNRDVLVSYLKDLNQGHLMIHLNDSQQDLGEDNRDVHDVLGRKMWDQKSLSMALELFHQHRWDCIIESSSGIVESLEFARKAAHFSRSARARRPRG
jgi:hypothetical protein